MEIYYLSSLDSMKFTSTRECIFLKRLRFNTGKECVLVKLSPPVIGQDYGLGTDIEEFVLTNRHEGEGLSPIREFPCFVFIARPLSDEIGQRDEISKDQVEVIAWGELYRTKLDADNHVFD
jgi:hypothetical protein